MFGMNGRKKIFTSVEQITAANIIAVVNSALNSHAENVTEIDRLYRYRRGDQPILHREKEIRPEICNKIVINNADMVVTFKNGYFLTKPATYVSRRADEAIALKVKDLNEYLYLSGKHEADNEVVDWFHTVGVAPIYIEANDSDDIPVSVYSLDPRSAFVVYSLAPGNKPVMGVHVAIQGSQVVVDCFTKDRRYTLLGGQVGLSDVSDGMPSVLAVDTLIDEQPNYSGVVPIIEYTYNATRCGAFENAIPIMDSINLVESNRADGIEQFIQSLMILYNCETDDNVTANDIREKGFIQLKNVDDNKADIKILSEQLDQSQTQTTLDDLYAQMLDKCCMPSVSHSNAGTSDNGSAVYLRSGYQQADTAARETADQFKKANRYFTEAFVAILQKRVGFEINLADFELYIEHNSAANLLVKTQAALNMKELGFAPALAFERSGLSSDPAEDVAISKEYIDFKWGTQNVPEVEEAEVESQGFREGENENVTPANID